MTAPPREPTPEPCVNCGKARSDHYIVNFADGPQISGMTWICPGSVYDAAPAPSADQDQNGGQGHEAYVHCSLGALPLESGNAREATCLNTEPSARTGTDTQQGQLGANAGSIPAPPTSTPAAQLAELVLPCAIDGCKQPSLMPASEYCSLHSAIGTSPTGGEFATQPAEPPAQATTDDLVQRLYDQDDECDGYSLYHEAAAELQRQAREIAVLQLAVKDDAQWAQENERLTRERDEWKCKCGDANVWGLRNAAAWKERAERSEAERDALREKFKLANDACRAAIKETEKIVDENHALRECVRAADDLRKAVVTDYNVSVMRGRYDAARAKVKP